MSLTSFSTDVYASAFALYDAGRTDEAEIRARTLLADRSIHKFRRMQMLILLCACVKEWGEAYSLYCDVEELWQGMRRRYREGADADVDEILANARDSIDHLHTVLLEISSESDEDDAESASESESSSDDETLVGEEEEQEDSSIVNIDGDHQVEAPDRVQSAGEAPSAEKVEATEPIEAAERISSVTQNHPTKKFESVEQSQSSDQTSLVGDMEKLLNIQ